MVKCCVVVGEYGWSSGLGPMSGQELGLLDVSLDGLCGRDGSVGRWWMMTDGIDDNECMLIVCACVAPCRHTGRKVWQRGSRSLFALHALAHIVGVTSACSPNLNGIYEKRTVD